MSTVPVAVAQFSPDTGRRRQPGRHRRARGDSIRSWRSSGRLPRVLELLRRPVRRVAARRTPKTSTARSRGAWPSSPPSTRWCIVAGLLERRATSAACATRWSPSTPRASSPHTASCISTTRSASASRTGSSRASSAPPRPSRSAGLRFGLMTCYDLRFPEVGAAARGCRRRCVPRAGGVGARPAQGAPLVDPPPCPRDREHRVRGGGRPSAAARRRALDDHRSAGRRRSPPWARRPTSRSPISMPTPSSGSGASIRRSRLRRFTVVAARLRSARERARGGMRRLRAPRRACRRRTARAWRTPPCAAESRKRSGGSPRPRRGGGAAGRSPRHPSPRVARHRPP